MFKPLTLSLSLAVALGACSVSMAGLFASPQCASPQGPVATSQCLPSAQCDPGCLPKKKHCFTMPHFNFPKPVHTYEWVLKKKIVWTHGNTCDTGIHPTSQCAPSAQSYGSPQSYGSAQAYPTAYGSGQAYGGTYGTSQYGSGQATGAPAAGQMMSPAPAAPTGDEAPPAPEVAPAAPAAPAAPDAPAAPSAPGPQSSLLFSTPSGN